jgi:hypothetical protein
MTEAEKYLLLTHNRHAEWNAYRRQHPGWVPDLSGMDLSGCDLAKFNLEWATLCGSLLGGATLPATGTTPGFCGWTYDLKTQFPASFDPVAAGGRYMNLAPDKPLQGMSIFPSYAWADQKAVAAVTCWLAEKGATIRADYLDFNGGSRLRDEIIRVMRTCDVGHEWHLNKRQFRTFAAILSQSS